MKKILLAILLLAINSFVFAQSEEEEVVDKIVDRLIVLAENEEFDKAMILCDSALGAHKQSAILHVIKGDLISKPNGFFTKDEAVYNQAFKEFVKALSIDPTFIIAHQRRGRLNLSHQKYDRAARDFTNVIRYSSKKNEETIYNALIDLASSNIYLRKYETAIKNLKLAKKIFPKKEAAYINAGLAYMNSEVYKKARKEYMKAYKINPKQPSLINNIGFLYLLEEKPAKAIPYYEEQMKMNPSDPLAYNNLGLAKIKLGEVEEGLKLVNKSLEIYPKNSYAYKHRAIAYIALGETEKACQDLEKANELGYTHTYGNEVNELIGANCKK